MSTSYLIPKHFRTTVVATNEEEAKKIEARLHSGCSRFEFSTLVITEAGIMVSAVLDRIAVECRKQRSHLVVIKQETIEHNRSFYRDLISKLAPAHCLLLVNHNIDTNVVVEKLLANILPSIKDKDWVLSNIIPICIELDDVEKLAALLSGVLIDELLHHHELTLDLSDDQWFWAQEVETASFHKAEVKELLEYLFIDDAQISLKRLNSIADNAVTIRPRSIVCEVHFAERVSVVMKIARKERVQRERRRFRKFIEGKLVGLRYARPEKVYLLWEIGGIVYNLLGAKASSGRSGMEKLKTFAEIYTTAQTIDDVQPLEKALWHLFTEVWSFLYERTRDSYKRNIPSLFDQYDNVWSKDDNPHSWSEKLYNVFIPDDKLRQPQFLHFRTTLRHPLPNPIRWAWEQRNNKNFECNRFAVTHGDLHGGNLFIDAHHECWLIDFERSGPGPLVQDFVELEVDIVTRLVNTEEEGLLPLYELVLIILHPNFIKKDTKGKLVNWPEHFGDELTKALQIITTLRVIANDIFAGYKEEEYLWGLLMNVLFVAEMTNERLHHGEEKLRQEKALLFGGLICARLGQLESGLEHIWPPLDWVQLRSQTMDSKGV